MKAATKTARLLLAPTLCLGGAALVLAPARPARGFSKLGGVLDETQRDVRVYDNFLDVQANDNVTPDPMFPGWTGVELAVWKGVVEWGSRLHGDGTGDPMGTNLLGDGGANFDAFWAGASSSIGTANDNVVSAVASCGNTGTLAYTETPISNGWRIRFCDEWQWDDGPGTVGTRYDVQGVMAHEYGHALGLGHSAVGKATMAPSVGAGQTGLRSIHADDIAGVQCLYGAASASKPTITATVAEQGGKQLVIHGTNFAADDNEVWFTSGAPTASGDDGIARVTGVASDGVLISVAVPPAAGPGDVLVKRPGTGGATLSNAFPTDLVGTIGTPPARQPVLTAVTPSTVDCLIPGTDQTVVLQGTDLDLVTTVLVNGNAVAPWRYTLVDPTKITLDMPQVGRLGQHQLGVGDGVTTSTIGITIVAPATPRYQVAGGDPFELVDRDDGLSMFMAGEPGHVHRAYVSLSDAPSAGPRVSLDLGNGFTQLVFAGQYVIPPRGWLEIKVAPDNIPDPGPSGATFYSQTFDLLFPAPFEVSNLQTTVITR